MPTEYLFIPTFDQLESQLGLVTKIYAIESGFRQNVTSFSPLHSFSIQGEAFQKQLIQRVFKNGKYGYTIDVTNNSLTSGTDKITVNGVDYVFISTSPTGTQIEIGADAAATETNIKNKLDAVSGISADTTTVTGKVFVYSDDITAITVTTSVSGKITVAQNDVAATLPIIFAGDTLTEGTFNVFQLPLTVNAKPDLVYFCVKTPASATLATLTQQCVDVLEHGVLGTDPTTKGMIFSKNKASRANIATAMVRAFASTTANSFVRSTTTSSNDTITLKLVGTHADYAGYAGNLVYAKFGLFASMPDYQITFGKNKNPIIANIGPLRPLGSTLNYKRTGAPQTSDQQQDSARVKFLTASTGIADQVSFVMNQVHNAELQALAAGAPSQSFNSQYNVVGFGGSLQKVGFIAVTENPNGDLHVDIVPEAFVTSGLDKDLAIGAAGGIAITATAFPDESAFPTGYSGVFRQSAQQ